jgi:hypothetical protein
MHPRQNILDSTQPLVWSEKKKSYFPRINARLSPRSVTKFKKQEYRIMKTPQILIFGYKLIWDTKSAKAYIMKLFFIWYSH